MRNLKNVVSTGCFFLCLGGWVYSGQLSAEDQVTQAREAALSTAVAQAAAPALAPEADPFVPLAQAVPGVTPGATPDPVTTSGANPPAPAAAAAAAAPVKPNTDLKDPVVNVEVDGKVKEIHFSDIDVITALNYLSLQTHRNIIASKNVKGSVSVNLFDVSFEETLDAMLKPNGFDYIKKGNFIYVYTRQELDDITKANRKPVTQIYHLKYINAQDAQILIKPFLSPSGVVAITTAAVSGLDSGSGALGGMSRATDDVLVINDFPEMIADVTAGLKSIDVRPKQVLIEATVLNASLKDNTGLGIDMVSLSGLNFSDILTTPISGGASTGGSGTGGASTSGGTPGAVAGTMIPGVSNTQVSSGTNFAKDVPSGGLSIGFLSNHISFFMRALETVTDVTVVANPKVLALNNMRGEVHIGQKLGYLTTSTSQTTTQQTVQFLDVGTKLVFRPYIADDGWVRMEIHPEDSSGAIDARGVPQTNTTEVNSNLMIRDGRTIVIGGLFSESTTASKGQVPILGNIPVLGPLMRSTNDATQRQETIVLVTPHIINDDTTLYQESLREQEDVQRMMLGNRAGLQPFGRDRIAHMWYAKAQESAAAGDKDKAIMFLDWALNTSPRMLEAIKMREQLTGKKMDEKTGSSVADLVKNVLQGDAATTPDRGGAAVYPQAPAPAPTDNK